MMRLFSFLMVVVIFVGFISGSALAGENWPMWRGADGTGTAAQGSNPPVSWSESENIKWKVKSPGHSLSTPVVWGEKMIFLTAISADEESTESAATAASSAKSYKFDIVCMDRNNGKILWQRTVKEEVPHEGHHATNSFASYSPVTDGEYVWASFGSRGVYCYDLDGNQKWSKDLGLMHTRRSFGEGSSPGLAGEALIVVMDQEKDSKIYALNKNTGEILWQKDRDERSSWSTPVAVEVDGKLQVISNAKNFIRSYDVQTGEIIWQCSGQTDNTIPVPVIGFDMVICMSGFRGNCAQAIKLNAKGDISGSDTIVWQVDKGTPYVPSPLLYGDKLYFGSGNKAIISCYNAQTGKPYFIEQKLKEMSELYASPVGSADRVYIAGRKGVTTVLKNSEKFEVLAINTLEDNFDASPVIIGDNIYLKGKANIYCIAKP